MISEERKEEIKYEQKLIKETQAKNGIQAISIIVGGTIITLGVVFLISILNP